MKVIYKQLISERIREEVMKAKSINRTIERIELTESEFCDLIDELTPQHFVRVPMHTSPLATGRMRYLDVDIVATEGGDEF